MVSHVISKKIEYKMANKKDIEKIKDSYFAVCPHTFEDILENEMKAIGIKKIKHQKGGITFDSTPEQAIELVFKTRVASKIYKQSYAFDIKVEKDIYFYAKEIKWKALFNIEHTFKIDVSLGHSPDGFKRSKFTNTMYLGMVLKDAIVDRFRDDTKGERPTISKDSPDVIIHMRIEPHDNKFSAKERVIISTDLCGQILSNRNYRLRGVEAPLRENLAAGLLIKAGLTEKDDFYDPMCGGGTFLAEALLIKGDITPSFIRIRNHFDENEEYEQWGFLNLEFYKKNQYLIDNTNNLLKELHEKNNKNIQAMIDKKVKIYGTDLDETSIKASTINLGHAGLLNLIYLEVADGTTFNPGKFKGKVVTNPPYGERLGEIEELKEVYYELGENFKQHFKGSEAFVLTSNIELLKKISLQTSFRHQLHNGKLEARFVKYELY